MLPLSDILILFPQALDDAAMCTAKSCLMNAGSSVLVHQKEGQSRVLLVKFAPGDVSPETLLNTVRDAGFDAKMSGG